jgi:exodeoxyribonuclease V beta subunit
VSGRPDWTVTAPLQRGLTVLEASAGTGKTWQIAHLVVRLVTEGELRVSELLVVTYTRAATAELRDRIRRRLVDAASALLIPARAVGDGGLEALVAAAAAQDCAGAWLQRLRRASEELDQATISTIHGFCQRMLRQHAFDSGADLDLELIGDPAALRGEVVDDLLSQALHDVDAGRYAFLTQEVGYNRRKLAEGVRAATGDPDLPVLPDPASPEPSPESLRPLVADFLATFDPDPLVLAVAQAVKSGLIRPKEGAKTQRSYSGKKARKTCDELVDWLQTWDPHGDEGPPGASWFRDDKLAPFTDPDAPFTHPEWDRARDLLAQLAGWPQQRVAWERAQVVAQARARLDARCQAAGQQTYSDLLRTLDHKLRPDSPTRERLRAVIAQRFGAVLIDEFQDTDARQWTLFETLFGGGQHHLYLIGDPKQAIYAFRGANVHVYAHAVATAQATTHGRVATMRRNFRSDDRYVRALNDLWGGDRDWFDSPAIRYESVTAKHEVDRLAPGVGWSQPGAAPVQLRFLDRGCLGEDLTESWLTRGEISDLLPQTVAADALALLTSGATLARDDGSTTPIGPGDLAVLVRTGRQAGQVVAALRSVGLPAVRSGGVSIFHSAAALVLRDFLAAMAAHRGDAVARRLALAPPFGWTGDRLVAVQQEEPDAVAAWEDWLASLGRWRALAARRGLLPAWRRALEETDALARLLARPDGERLVTDLGHAMSLLHEAQVSERLRLPALVRWYEARRAGADDRAEEEQLRLERDDAAIQVVTLHSSKGLQYPVVFLPWLWEGVKLRASDWLIVPTADDPTLRVLDLRPSSDRADAQERAWREARSESMRLAYVGLTRACHRAVLYAGAIDDYASSPAASLLHGPAVGGTDDLLDRVLEHVSVASPGTLWTELQTLSTTLRGPDGTSLLSASRVEPLVAPGSWRPDTAREAGVPRDFDRHGLDSVWGRTSYTALVKGRELGHEDLDAQAVEAFEADHDQAAELPASLDRVLVPPPPVDATGQADLPLAAFPSGADAGTCLHAVFEHLDFQGDAEHVACIAKTELMRHGMDPETLLAALVPGLLSVLQTPLGGGLGTLCLADLPQGQRLDELRFDLPIAGGDRHRRGDHPDQCTPRLDGRALARALGHSGWGPRSEYLDAVASLDFGPLAGFLTGSIDLVFRHPDGRWWVADYKSNRLDPHRTGRCVSSQFSQVHLAHEMERHHYYLQGALYSLALHRWLRSRLGPEHYDPERDLGGAAYLFVRGMTGPDTPVIDDRRHGVCLFRSPLAMLDQLDALFDDPNAAGGAL